MGIDNSAASARKVIALLNSALNNRLTTRPIRKSSAALSRTAITAPFICMPDFIIGGTAAGRQAYDLTNRPPEKRRNFCVSFCLPDSENFRDITETYEFRRPTLCRQSVKSVTAEQSREGKQAKPVFPQSHPSASCEAR